MARLTLSKPADVYAGNPFDRNRVEDRDVFRQLHGIHSNDDWCSNYIDDSFVASLKLTGGRVRFAYNEKTDQFLVTTTYGIGRKPTNKELRYLSDQTSAQWSDGIGNGSFSNHDKSICSMSLAMAILNSQPDELPNLSDYFVDAYPMGSSATAPKIQFSTSGGPDDVLINDLKTAIQNGSGSACRELSEYYLNGHYVERNEARALKLLKKSAKLKDETAIVQLSQMYMNGQGVRQDTMKAIHLLEAGVKLGSDLSKVVLADLFLNGDPNNHTRAIQMLQESVQGLYPSAVYRLAGCYEYGQGIPRNLGKAQKLYESAMKLGFDSKNDIKRVKKQRGLFGRLFGK